MRQLLLTAILSICLALPATTEAANKAPEGFAVVENQPEGELRIYNRSGKFVKEIVENEEYHYLTTDVQTGTINIVFAADGSVYFQRPVSESYYDGWVRGTLSADGRTITVPAGQYTAYTRSFDMAVQVWMMRYDEQNDTYVADESITDIVYTIDDNGTIHLQGTGETTDSGLPLLALGCVNRCFGDTFSYLDFEWHNNGSDYETVYTPAGMEQPTPPEGLQTQQLIATTGMMDGIEWDAYNGMVNIGFDGDDVWLQGISNFLPQAWVKGHREGNTVTFQTGQLLGSYFNRTVYLIGARSDDEGNPVLTDIVFTYDGEGTYTSYTDIFLSTEKDDIAYIIYYMGLTLADHPDQTIEAPIGLQTEPYTMTYKEPDDLGRLKSKTATVQVGIDQEQGNIYIQGITPLLPDAYIVGAMANGEVAFASPQFLGTYSDETAGDYPIFFQSYNGQTGELVPGMAFSYNSATRELTAPTATIGIGINKTGLLGLQNMYAVTLTPVNSAGITEMANNESRTANPVYDLQGRRVSKWKKGLFISNGKKTLRY